MKKSPNNPPRNLFGGVGSSVNSSIGSISRPKFPHSSLRSGLERSTSKGTVGEKCRNPTRQRSQYLPIFYSPQRGQQWLEIAAVTAQKALLFRLRNSRCVAKARSKAFCASMQQRVSSLSEVSLLSSVLLSSMPPSNTQE